MRKLLHQRWICFCLRRSHFSYGPAQTLLSFNQSNSLNPFAGLLRDGNGDLFGTTAGGGAYRGGVVFEIPKTSSGYGPVHILVSFSPAGPGSVGNSQAGLISDGAGNLFGNDRRRHRRVGHRVRDSQEVVRLRPGSNPCVLRLCERWSFEGRLDQRRQWRSVWNDFGGGILGRRRIWARHYIRDPQNLFRIRPAAELS